MSAVPTPKDRFTSLDTLALVRELRSVRHARIDKVFDLPAGGWSLALRVPREGRRELLLVPGRFAALLSEAVAHSDELTPFARELRRLLEGAVVESVPDPAGERFLEVTLRRSDEPQPILLALEMFGTGNLVVARGGAIVAVAQTRRWAHRTIAIGSQYARPPTRTDPWTVGVAEIEAELSRSRTDLASTLAARLALGGPLAEEIVARGEWDASRAAASEAGKLAPELHRVLQELLSEVGDRPSGFLYLRAGIAVDATPYRSRRWRDVGDVEEVLRPTFSTAATEYFPTLVAAPVSQEEQERAQVRKDLEHQLDQQRAAVVGARSPRRGTEGGRSGRLRSLPRGGNGSRRSSSSKREGTFVGDFPRGSKGIAAPRGESSHHRPATIRRGEAGPSQVERGGERDRGRRGEAHGHDRLQRAHSLSRRPVDSGRPCEALPLVRAVSLVHQFGGGRGRRRARCRARTTSW